MSDNSDPIDVIVDELDAQPEIRVERAGDKRTDPEEGIESLRAQLEDARRARDEAEKRANQASDVAYRATTESQENQMHLVTNAIETVRQNNEILKANYRAAMSVDDYDSAVEIQNDMATNAAKLLQLQQGREALESQPRQSAPEPYRADPVEALASQLTPRSADWIRRNQKFARDPKMYQRMIAAHNLAVTDDITPDSDEYFENIERTLGVQSQYSDRNSADPSGDAAKITQRRSSPAAAPVTRSGSTNGSRPTTVRLTSMEAEMASMMGMTEKEYALNKIALQKEGKMH
jgi:hypothetical protein